MALYMCDPNKHTKCKRTYCYERCDRNPCFLTGHVEFAKLDHEGQPIKAKESVN